MTNKKVINYYNKMAEKIVRPNETRNKAKDFSKYDIEFMKNIASKDKVLLDLGAGTGLLINYLNTAFKKIVAVEKYIEFSNFIKDSPNIKIINADILDFSIEDDFDVISLFGVMNYFNEKESLSIYKKLIVLLKKNGKLIIKNQFGVNEDVVIDGFSEELQTNYYSEYRHVTKEVELLKALGFNKVEIINIYPDDYNRWENTHFYALVCEK